MNRTEQWNREENEELFAQGAICGDEKVSGMDSDCGHLLNLPVSLTSTLHSGAYDTICVMHRSP